MIHRNHSGFQDLIRRSIVRRESCSTVSSMIWSPFSELNCSKRDRVITSSPTRFIKSSSYGCRLEPSGRHWKELSYSSSSGGPITISVSVSLNSPPLHQERFGANGCPQPWPHPTSSLKSEPESPKVSTQDPNNKFILKLLIFQFFGGGGSYVRHHRGLLTLENHKSTGSFEQTIFL